MTNYCGIQFTLLNSSHYLQFGMTGIGIYALVVSYVKYYDI